MKNYSEMTVKELREESKGRGLTLEYKGKKFTKPELIARLEELDGVEAGDLEDWEQEETEETAVEVETKQEVVEEQKTEAVEEQPQQDYIKFAKTFDEIVKKYSGRKKQYVYDEELKVGSIVVFVHHVQARDDETYKKIRTAKVVGVNRKQERVRVVTLLGTELELLFDELLYIRNAENGTDYPKDIAVFLKKRRTEKGKALINERFGEKVTTN